MTRHTGKIEYGVLFEHASQDVYEDLVGPTYGTLAKASDARLAAARQGGYRGAIVQREDGGEWTELHSGKSPVEWLRDVRG